MQGKFKPTWASSVSYPELLYVVTVSAWVELVEPAGELCGLLLKLFQIMTL